MRLLTFHDWTIQNHRIQLRVKLNKCVCSDVPSLLEKKNKFFSQQWRVQVGIYRILILFCLQVCAQCSVFPFDRIRMPKRREELESRTNNKSIVWAHRVLDITYSFHSEMAKRIGLFLFALPSRNENELILHINVCVPCASSLQSTLCHLWPASLATTPRTKDDRKRCQQKVKRRTNPTS